MTRDTGEAEMTNASVSSASSVFSWEATRAGLDSDPYAAGETCAARELEQYYIHSILDDDDPFDQAYFGGRGRGGGGSAAGLAAGGGGSSSSSSGVAVTPSALLPSLDAGALPLTLENLQLLDDAPRQPQVNRSLYKTELCKSFSTTGHCNYGNKCQFAHGLHELQKKRTSSNFRTKPCINWTRSGYCPYGKRCCFKHGDDEDILIYKAVGAYSTVPHPMPQALMGAMNYSQGSFQGYPQTMPLQHTMMRSRIFEDQIPRYNTTTF